MSIPRKKVMSHPDETTQKLMLQLNQCQSGIYMDSCVGDVVFTLGSV